MPIPTPQSQDTQSQFISKCINDSVMKEEYPTAQRIAVCYDAWNIRRK
jgi:hypothetical protein|tara:strand:- start:427 stop:570 length:144 start_codon:yes stop_codon:yes gene_type:complete